jgi:hypothetical protein
VKFMKHFQRGARYKISETSVYYNISAVSSEPPGIVVIVP